MTANKKLTESGWPWQEGNTALKDGTPIVAIGRIIESDELLTCVTPFVAAIRWFRDQSNYEGWHYDSDRMTVARTLDDKIMVDWWLPMPSEPAAKLSDTKGQP